MKAADSASGIIPALAGNTRTSVTGTRLRWDHPRSRGEYPVRGGFGVWWWGSSPLSRGIPSCSTPATPSHGIIPALAGNTVALAIFVVVSKDHPRSRGEYAVGRGRAAEPAGSSPLSRGIPGRVIGQGSRYGIIPALAGNTPRRGTAFLHCTDHPRSRGEYITENLEASLIGGSSPLSRGIPHHPAANVAVQGIIPALAGNTQ